MSLFKHYAFDNVRKYPPTRRRIRAAFAPQRINARLFLVDRIRPFPEWPLICKATGHPAFESESACKQWLAKFMMDSQVWKIWKCDKCNLFHHFCFPLEATGSSSGKSVRKISFLALRKAEEEETEDQDDLG